MARLYKDEDTGIVHIQLENCGTALCGLQNGWSDHQEPVKRRYGSTCQECQDELVELKSLKLNLNENL